MFTTPIIGFRSWRVEHGRLYSCTQKVVWPHDRKAVTECRTHFLMEAHPNRPASHSDPVHPQCSCGLYGWYDLENALREYVVNSKSVVGAAVYWGRIQVHVGGLRAEFARPVALVNERWGETKDRPLNWSGLLDQTLERYRIPLLPLEDLKPYALTFGEQVGNSITE